MRLGHRGEGNVKMKVEIGRRQPQAKGLWSHQELEEARKDSPLEPWEGVQQH